MNWDKDTHPQQIMIDDPQKEKHKDKQLSSPEAPKQERKERQPKQAQQNIQAAMVYSNINQKYHIRSERDMANKHRYFWGVPKVHQNKLC